MRLSLAGALLLLSAGIARAQEVPEKQPSPDPQLPAPVMPAAPAPTEVIELEALKVNSGTVKNSMTTDRKNAKISVDLLTTADFGKFISTDVADLVIKMPGLSTTSQGSFAVVRGLAERYNPVMLDGIGLPSSDPEHQSPELDIFPTRLVDAIVISKTFDPSLPGTASGAGIDIRTKPLPEGRFVQVRVGVRADEGYIKDEKFLTSDAGGRHDYFGLGNKDRIFAPALSTRLARSNPAAIDTDATALATKFIQNYVQLPGTARGTRDAKFPLGGSFALTAEDRIVLNEEKGRALGYVFSLAWDRSASTEEGQTLGTPLISSSQPPPNFATEPQTFRVAEYFEAELEHRMGVFGSVGFAFNPEHQISLSLFWSQVGVELNEREFNDVIVGARYDQLDAVRQSLSTRPGTLFKTLQDTGANLAFGPFGSEESYYRERRLYDLNLRGEHRFPVMSKTLDALKVNWAAARINATQLEPEYSIIPYNDNTAIGIPLGRPGAIDSSYGATGIPLDSFSLFWRDTDEWSWAYRLGIEGEFTIGFLPDTLTLGAGYYGDRTRRNFREFSLNLTLGGGTGRTFPEFADDLFATVQSGFGLNPNGAFAEASRQLDAFYLSGTIPLARDRPGVSKLDLFGGVRREQIALNSLGVGKFGNETSRGFYLSYYQQIRDLAGQTNLPAAGSDLTGRIHESRTLPSVGINYSPVKPLTIRLAFSKTTARPSFREVGSYFTDDRVTDEFVHGNKDLRTSDVRNQDMRFEYFFPRSKDLVALSFFKKTVSNPIERVAVNQPNLGFISTWVNNPNSASVRGFEFELAKNLGFLGAAGSPFTLGGNFTRVEAKVKRIEFFEDVAFRTTQLTDERRLFDQPESIANVYGTYDHQSSGFTATLSFFKISELLQRVGGSQSYDTYVDGYSRWDLTIGQRLGRSWTLRLSARNLQDPERKLILDPQVSAPVEIVLRRWTDGRSYTLNLVYDF